MFDPISNPIDYILLANRRSPGIAEVTNVSSPRRWDERRGFALSGARVVFRGNALSYPIVMLRLLEPQHFTDWNAWKQLLDRPPVGERAHAMDIWHPLLEDAGIDSVVIQDVLQPKQTADGEWTVEIKMIEYRPPVLMLSIPDGSQERTEDPVDRAIENLQNQAQALANE